jgi:hypothetical protein
MSKIILPKQQVNEFRPLLLDVMRYKDMDEYTLFLHEPVGNPRLSILTT